MTAIAFSGLGLAILALNFAVGEQRDNPAIGLAMLIAVAGLLLGATGRAPRLTAHIQTGALFVGAVLSSVDTGFDHTGWAWMLLVPVIAALLISRTGALGWSAVVASTLCLFAVGHSAGWIPLQDYGPEAPAAAALTGIQILAFLAVALSVFRRQQVTVEVRLRSTVEDLEAEVRTRRAAEEAATQAVKAKATFLATMSHEIRTPMNGVLGASQLLGETQLQPEQQELLDTLEGSAEMLLDLINDVLDLSRLDAGGVVFEEVPVDLRSLVANTTAPVRLRARAKGVQLETLIAEDVPRWVVGDPTRLRQILLNLSSNAAKFTENGMIRVRVERDADRFRLIIEDSGIGIPREAQATLFDPFVQAEASTTRRFGGSGLGLSIVWRLVTGMGGTVSVQSEPDVGSTFVVELPLVATEAPSHEPSFMPSEGEELSLRLLVVDDNPVNRMVASRMLARLGHVVLDVESGPEALDRLQEAPFDAVFMDVQMPGMDGLEATRALRELPPPASHTVVIGLTANALPGDREKVIEAGMDDYLAKPVRLQDLRAALNRWIARSELSQSA